MKNNKYTAIDFFCGGGGMTCGLRQAGIDVVAGVDFDREAQNTYEINNPGSVFVETNIRDRYRRLERTCQTSFFRRIGGF